MNDLQASMPLPYVCDVPAERAFLGSLIHRPDLIGSTPVRVDDLTVPAHGHLLAILTELTTAGAVVDPQTLLAAIRKRGLLSQFDNGAYLVTLMERAWAPENVAAYATAVLDASHRRKLAAAAVRAYQQAHSDTADLTGAVAMLAAEVDALTTLPVAVPPPLTAREFLARPHTHDWLIEGVLERMDRLMITGFEGSGKSELTRMIAVCAAHGLHPFTQRGIPHVRTLLVDLENGAAHLARRLRLLFTQAGVEGAEMPSEDYLRIETRPEGIDLTKPDEQAWLMARVTASAPELIVIGPLYRMHAADMNDETAARALTAGLDAIRSRTGAALVIEAHAGHGTGTAKHRALRPTGSSLFMRWPEFGFGLRPLGDSGAVEIDEWRGPRDERAWPRMLRRGGAWPWTETVETVWGAA